MVRRLVNAPLMVLVGYKKDAEEDNKRAAIPRPPFGWSFYRLLIDRERIKEG